MACWLITGAGRGIGLGLAAKLLARRDEVIALVRDPLQAQALKKLEGAAKSLTVLGGEVTDQASLLKARDELGARHIDVLVNNAGVYLERGKGVLTADMDRFAETLLVNTVAPLRVIQAFAPLMGGKGGISKAATISSGMGSLQRGGTGEFSYRASKAGVNKAIQAVAGELRQAGIIAFVMHPGWVRSDMGGAGADISIEQSAAGLIATIEAAGDSAAGEFLNYDGTSLPW